MDTDTVVLIIKLFILYYFFIVFKICMSIYLFDYTCIFYVEYIDNFSICVLFMCDCFHIHMELYFDWIYGK